MTFGVNLRKQRTGADVCVLIFQLSALLAVPYVFVASGYLYLVTYRSVLAALFDLGLSALPRWETLAVSWIYRQSSSEVIAYFVMLIAALASGLLAKRFLQGSHETGVRIRIIESALIALDLIARLLPFHFNAAYGTVCAVLGFAVRLACLALLILDLRADRRARSGEKEGGGH